MENASKLVSSAMLGYDAKTIIVGGKVYFMEPPTIHKIVGASYYLSDVEDASTMREVLATLKNMDSGAHALSWFIKGSDELYEEFKEASPDEVIDGIGMAMSLISTQNFLRLSVFARSVRNLIASQKQ